jgi:xanthine dehydrogenase YagT iron-sulfur-binding subunit
LEECKKQIYKQLGVLANGALSCNIPQNFVVTFSMQSPHTPQTGQESHNSRRNFLKKSALLTAAAALPPFMEAAAEDRLDEQWAHELEMLPLNITINGTPQQLKIDPRTTLLDLLREQLQLTGTKKGCDHGQCGACTVHINGQRVNACLTLAIMQEGQQVTTIEGLAKGDELHPMQQAFIKCDGFQCGYCTPGQIMSAIACVQEGHATSDAQIKEFMSGNLCRCGAYNGIVNAIKQNCP